jgi:hypothetical protein
MHTSVLKTSPQKMPDQKYWEQFEGSGVDVLLSMESPRPMEFGTRVGNVIFPSVKTGGRVVLSLEDVAMLKVQLQLGPLRLVAFFK